MKIVVWSAGNASRLNSLDWLVYITNYIQLILNYIEILAPLVFRLKEKATAPCKFPTLALQLVIILQPHLRTLSVIPHDNPMALVTGYNESPGAKRPSTYA